MPGLIRVAPPLFVLLWSSAFVGAKFGLPYVEPLTFMWLRFLLVTVLFLILAKVFRSPWPDNLRATAHIAVVGFLIQALYLSGTFIAISNGASVGLVALILGLQPVLTVLFVSLISAASVRGLQLVGVILGFAGLLLVVWDKLGIGEVGVSTVLPVGFGVLCITAGTLYQRRFCSGMNLMTGNAIQAVVATVTTGLLALAFEDRQIDWDTRFIGALAWMVIVVSLGAHSLFLLMLRHGHATGVSSLFYLTPPTAAVMAFFMFGEVLTVASLAGFVIAAGGVALVLRGEPSLQRSASRQ